MISTDGSQGPHYLFSNLKWMWRCSQCLSDVQLEEASPSSSVLSVWITWTSDSVAAFMVTSTDIFQIHLRKCARPESSTWFILFYLCAATVVSTSQLTLYLTVFQLIFSNKVEARLNIGKKWQVEKIKHQVVSSLILIMSICWSVPGHTDPPPHCLPICPLVCGCWGKVLRSVFRGHMCDYKRCVSVWTNEWTNNIQSPLQSLDQVNLLIPKGLFMFSAWKWHKLKEVIISLQL